MYKYKLLILLLVSVLTNSLFSQDVIEATKQSVSSPDHNYLFSFYQKTIGGGKQQMYYTVSYKGQPVILESSLGLQLDNHLSEQAMAITRDSTNMWTENLVVKKIAHSNFDSSWKPVVGETAMIRDHYNALTVDLQKASNAIYDMQLQIRAYNEGIAFRYFFPENSKGTYYRVMEENSAFSLPANTKAWFTGWAQGKYALLPLKDWPQESERPLTLQLNNGLHACLAEANMTDYARTKFKLSDNKPNTILTSMYTPVDLISPVGTPWRVVMVAEKAGTLIENNFLLLNLNTACKVKDPSWIKPGKIIRVMTQTTNDAIENIDFAAKHNMQYILFDWKWYGPAFSFDSDATTVSIPDFDLEKIIAYGKQKGIGVWLYVNQQALLAQSDSLFRVYHKWGIKGVKFGFVQVGSHRWTTWIQDMFRKAAENEIMVNVHDDWRPTGEQRTWPNLMTAEGIRGNEEMPDATHNTVLPFTRFIAGAADYTLCYYDKRIKTTHAHQLAMAAVYYSPIQTLFWYDKPAMSHNEPELEFWDKIPCTWDETKVLQGQPGEFITTARRSGNNWFIGTLNNNDAKNLKLSFDFLPAGKRYNATFYFDDDNAITQTKVGITKMTVEKNTVVDLKLKASGGQAVWLTRVE